MAIPFYHPFYRPLYHPHYHPGYHFADVSKLVRRNSCATLLSYSVIPNYLCNVSQCHYNVPRVSSDLVIFCPISQDFHEIAQIVKRSPQDSGNKKAPCYGCSFAKELFMKTRNWKCPEAPRNRPRICTLLIHLVLFLIISQTCSNVSIKSKIYDVYCPLKCSHNVPEC